MASKRRTVRAWDMDIFARVLSELPDGKWITRVARYNRLARENRTAGAMFCQWRDRKEELPPIKPPEISRPIDADTLRRLAAIPSRSLVELTARYNAETGESRSKSGIEGACLRHGIERARKPRSAPVPKPPEARVNIEGTGLTLPADAVAAYREILGANPEKAETREEEVAFREAIAARDRADAVGRWRREWKRLRRDWVPFRRLEASA